MPALLYRTTMPHPDDPDIVATISQAMSTGHPLSTAAALAGIHEDTLYHWLDAGKAEIQAAEGTWKPWTELGARAQLVIHVKEALAGLVSEGLDHVRAGDKDWAAWMTLLERRMPQDFGRFQRVEIEQRTVTLSITAQLPPEAAQALLAMAQAERAEGTKFLPTGGPEPEPSSPAPDSA